MKKKEKLIAALEEERRRFDKMHQDTTDHDVAINWLKYGLLPSQGIDQFELLDAAVNDFDTLCSDYDVV